MHLLLIMEEDTQLWEAVVTHRWEDILQEVMDTHLPRTHHRLRASIQDMVMRIQVIPLNRAILDQVLMATLSQDTHLLLQDTPIQGTRPNLQGIQPSQSLPILVPQEGHPIRLSRHTTHHTTQPTRQLHRNLQRLKMRISNKPVIQESPAPVQEPRVECRPAQSPQDPFAQKRPSQRL